MTNSAEDLARLRGFAEKYTAAWCSQDPARVAACYEENGSLRVNEDDPAVGREAITAVARGFMTTFPDMKVIMDDIQLQGDGTVYHWTLVGTNSGPGGTGNRVRISGFEVWRIGPFGLIEESLGQFDNAAYEHQLAHGVADPH